MSPRSLAGQVRTSGDMAGESSRSSGSNDVPVPSMPSRSTKLVMRIGRTAPDELRVEQTRDRGEDVLMHSGVSFAPRTPP